MDPQTLRNILQNLNNKLTRQEQATESTKAQITIFSDQLDMFKTIPVKSPKK